MHIHLHICIHNLKQTENRGHCVWSLTVKVEPFLCFILIHAFISSLPDFCKSLYLGVRQLVQNAATLLLTGTHKRDHISPILASLHWLPVSFRIDFKALSFIFKAFLHDHRGLLSKCAYRSRLKHRGDGTFTETMEQTLHMRTSPTLHF